jgi:hypothetical protein
MTMFEKIYFKYSDTLPVIGGAGGAVSQAPKLFHFLPSPEQIICTIILTAIGGFVGYLVKVGLDKLFKK